METVEGGDSGGEYSGLSTHPTTAVVGFSSAEAVSQIVVIATGWRATVFVSSALS
jgi:pheromone shutdown protein TraB